ncbi:MAG: hypothetical protein LBP65_03010 [Puniceicoccales bacterium]|jgi:hypothetical protein|nr:hypothetical protein [Puniceicoccales bacterium]
MAVSSDLWNTAKDVASVSTMENLYKVLVQVVAKQETDLNSEIQSLSGTGTIDQGTLLKVQGMVQTWGVTSGLATGTLRAAGDTLTKTTQNIR